VIIFLAISLVVNFVTIIIIVGLSVFTRGKLFCWFVLLYLCYC